MSIKLTEVLVHVDWGKSHGEVHYKYNAPVDSPYGFAPLAEIILSPDRLESADGIEHPIFGASGSFKVVPEIGTKGLYVLRLRPYHRLRSVIVEPEEVVVDLHANKDESITYTFYNPTRRSSIIVSGQLTEDIDGFYRKLTAHADDPIWRQSLILRSLAASEVESKDLSSGRYPALMTARQLAEYLQLDEKTIRKWTSDGTVPHKKLGSAVRYPKSEIEEAIKQGNIGGAKGSSRKTKGRRTAGR
jgi:excisionase family DNA binding protein